MKLTITLLASLTLAVASFAGQEIEYSGKDKKIIVPPTCFNDQELQLDVFGAYVDGNASNHAGPIRDHGWGGGIGVNYFFSRYIGVGVEGYWIAADSNSSSLSLRDRVRDRFDQDSDRTTFHNVNGSLIFRLPMDDICLAPYAFLGGGAVLDGDKWAVGFAGLGLEYRVVPNKVGLFFDARWNYYGDRYGHEDQNNFTGRAGVRWVF